MFLSVPWQKVFVAENSGTAVFYGSWDTASGKVTSTPISYLSLFLKHTAEVPYPVCKQCYDSADYKGFKQFSTMNSVRTIWGWTRFIRYAANPVFITSTGSFNSPMPGMCRMRAVYTKSGVMNKDTIFTVSSRYRIPDNTGIIYQLTCPESWSRDRLQELYFMFSPGTVSDITLNIFLILVKKEKNITIYPAAASSGYTPSKQLVKKRSVKFG